MKKIETAFSCLSFSVAGVSAAMLYLRMPDFAYYVATVGTMMTIMAYAAVKHVMRDAAELD